MLNYKNRIFFIDYLRGVMVFFVILDHSMHIYSPHFKNFWFLQDFGGSIFFDIWHMYNDVIMMPMLFFIAGMFVISSLNRHGLSGFLKEKFYRFCIPFVFGIFFIVPLLKYPQYLIKNDSTITFLNYLQEIYFFKGISGGGFWFLYYLALLTIILLVLHYYIPALLKLFTNYARYIIDNPYKGIVSVILIIAVILGVSDMCFGAHWWIGFGKVFYVRSARFIMKAFMFFLGAGFAQTNFLQDKKLINFSNNWKRFLIISLCSGGIYITYSLVYFYEGAYKIEILKHFYFGGSWTNFWCVFFQYSPMILIRNSLLAIFLCLTIFAYFAIFKKFFDRKIIFLQLLATYSFGMYIFHEPFVILVHYWLYLSDTPLLIKFVLSAGIAFGVSWQITKFLKPQPLFRKIL